MNPSKETANSASFARSHTASNRERASAADSPESSVSVRVATSCRSTRRPPISGLELSERLIFGRVDGQETVEVQEPHHRVHRRGEGDKAHGSGLLLKLLHEDQEGPDPAGSHERNLGEVQDEVLTVRLNVRDPL